MTSAARHDRFEVRSRRRHLVPDEEVREDVGHLSEANETKDKHNAEEELNTTGTKTDLVWIVFVNRVTHLREHLHLVLA